VYHKVRKDTANNYNHNDNDNGENDDDDPVHAAMSYVPSEAPINRPPSPSPSHQLQHVHGVLETKNPSTVAVMGLAVKSLYGIDVGALQPPLDHQAGQGQGQGEGQGRVMVCRVIVAYKCSLRYVPWYLLCREHMVIAVILMICLWIHV
jgi:hypothetical protein